MLMNALINGSVKIAQNQRLEWQKTNFLVCSIDHLPGLLDILSQVHDLHLVVFRQFQSGSYLLRYGPHDAG